MAATKISDDIAIISSKYRTKLSIFTAPISGIQRILLGNGRRWWVRFDTVGLAAYTNPILPASFVDFASYPSGSPTLPMEFKYTDCPSVVTGEWYAGINAGGQVLIWECLYTG